MDLSSSIESLLGWQIFPILMFFILATYSDIQSKKIYNWNSGGLAIFNAIFFVLIPLVQGDWKTASIHGLGGIISFLILLLPATFLLIKMGGDIKFAGAAGIALGPILSITWIFVAIAFSYVYGKFQIKNSDHLDIRFPLAPFFFISLILHLVLYFVIL